MNRPIERWQACNPTAMATEQSEAARIYAFEDAKHDILELHAEVERLRDVLTAISVQGPYHGPDGTTRTWVHWKTIAQRALLEAP